MWECRFVTRAAADERLQSAELEAAPIAALCQPALLPYAPALVSHRNSAYRSPEGRPTASFIFRMSRWSTQLIMVDAQILATFVEPNMLSLRLCSGFKAIVRGAGLPDRCAGRVSRDRQQ